MFFAGNSLEAVGGQCAGEHAVEGVPAVFDGVFSQVVGKVAYAAQGVMVVVQQSATGSEVAVAPWSFLSCATARTVPCRIPAPGTLWQYPSQELAGI